MNKSQSTSFLSFIDKTISWQTVSRASNMKTVSFGGKGWNLMTFQPWSFYLFSIHHHHTLKRFHLFLNPQAPTYSFIQRTDNMIKKKKTIQYSKLMRLLQSCSGWRWRAGQFASSEIKMIRAEKRRKENRIMCQKLKVAPWQCNNASKSEFPGRMETVVLWKK